MGGAVELENESYGDYVTWSGSLVYEHLSLILWQEILTLYSSASISTLFRIKYVAQVNEAEILCKLLHSPLSQDYC